jgi:nitrate/nitrite-specific signal transduction histidine kinase
MTQLNAKMLSRPRLGKSNVNGSFKLHGLRAKIIAWAFVPTAIILLAVALVTYMAYRQVTEELVIGRDRELVRLSADQLIGGIADYSERLAAVARTNDLQSGNAATQQQALEEARNRLIVFDAGVVIFDNFGSVVAASPPRPEIIGQNWNNHTYIRQMLLSSRTTFSDVVADGPDGTEVIALAVPIFGPRGQFRGMLAGMFKVSPDTLSSFYGDIVKLRLNKRGTAYLVDSKGRVIYHSNPARIGDDLSDQEVVKKVIRREINALRTQDRQGQDIVAAYSPIPGTPWGLITEESWAALSSASQGYRQFLAILLILGFVVPSLFVAFGVRRITQPIEEVITAAQKIAGGDFNQKINVSTNDEIAELARQFNQMSVQLQTLYTEMEQRVADRTKELTTLYDIAQATTHSLDLQETLCAALEEVLSVLDFDLGVIYLKNPRTGNLEPVFELGMSEALRNAATRGTLSNRVAATGAPMIVDDLSTVENPPEALLAEGYTSVASIPLIAKQEVQGVLSAATRHRHSFRPQDVELLTSIGRQVGIAIENAKLYETQQRRAEQFRVIGEMGHNINSILNVEDLLHEMANMIQSTFSYYHVGIGLVQDEYVVYQVGAGPLWEAARHQFMPARLKIGHEGISGTVAATGELYLAPDVREDPRYVEMAGSMAVSELILPIKAKGIVIGVLDVQQDYPNAFDEIEMTVLQSLANQAGVAIENARLYAQAKQLAVLEERQRLARDLHDSVTQSLYGATLYAEAAARLVDNGNYIMAAEHLRELRDTTHEALGEMRLLIFELRPSMLESEGLSAALHARLESVESRAGVKTEIFVDGIQKLPPSVEEEFYWISQEVLNNTLKHAKADFVSLSLCPVPDRHLVQLKITDNGRGFDLEEARQSGGWGLRGIEERVKIMNGLLFVNSVPGQGTTVIVEIPYFIDDTITEIA